MKKIVSMAKKAVGTLHRCWRRLQVFIVRGLPTPPLSHEMATCRHCGHVFSGNYCPRCGQFRDAGKGKPRLLRTFREAYPQLSGNFIRTIIHLTLRPGYMISDYFRGHRVLYQNPVSTFLIAVSIVALCSGIIGNIMRGGEKKVDKSFMGVMDRHLAEEISKEAKKDANVRKAYERWSIMRRLEGHRRTAAALHEAKDKLTSDVSLRLFALFPVLGSISYFVMRKRTFDGRRLTLMEHYVIFAYLYAFFSFVSSIEIIPWIYIAWTYRGIYRLSWLKSICYAAIVICLTSIVIFMLIIVFIAFMLAPILYYSNF